MQHEILQFLKNKRNLINLLSLIVILVAIPPEISFIRQRQILSSRASGQPIQVLLNGNTVFQRNNKVVAIQQPNKTSINLQLSSPLGPPAPPGIALAPKKNGVTLASFVNNVGGFAKPVHAADSCNGVAPGGPVNTCIQYCPGTQTVCASGHIYCVYDPNGNHPGNCSLENNTCDQCGKPASGNGNTGGNINVANTGNISSSGGVFTSSCNQCIYDKKGQLGEPLDVILNRMGAQIGDQDKVNQSVRVWCTGDATHAAVDATGCNQIKNTSCKTQCGGSSSNGSNGSNGGGAACSGHITAQCSNGTPKIVIKDWNILNSGNGNSCNVFLRDGGDHQIKDPQRCGPANWGSDQGFNDPKYQVQSGVTYHLILSNGGNCNNVDVDHVTAPSCSPGQNTDPVSGTGPGQGGSTGGSGDPGSGTSDIKTCQVDQSLLDQVTDSCASCLAQNHPGIPQQLAKDNASVTCGNREAYAYWCGSGVSVEANQQCQDLKNGACKSACPPPAYNGPTHMACSASDPNNAQNSCILVRGSGSNDCSTNADCCRVIHAGDNRYSSPHMEDRGGSTGCIAVAGCGISNCGGTINLMNAECVGDTAQAARLGITLGNPDIETFFDAAVGATSYTITRTDTSNNNQVSFQKTTFDNNNETGQVYRDVTPTPGHVYSYAVTAHTQSGDIVYHNGSNVSGTPGNTFHVNSNPVYTPACPGTSTPSPTPLGATPAPVTTNPPTPLPTEAGTSPPFGTPPPFETSAPTPLPTNPPVNTPFPTPLPTTPPNGTPFPTPIPTSPPGTPPPFGTPQPTPLPTSPGGVIPVPTPVPVFTTSFKISEDPTSIDNSPSIPYTSDGMVIAHELADNVLGTKTVFIKYFDNKGKSEQDSTTLDLVAPDPKIQTISCNLDLNGNGINFELTGTNFGDKGGALGSDQGGITVQNWSDQDITGSLSGTPSAGNKTYNVSLNRADGQTDSVRCTVGISDIIVKSAPACPTLVSLKQRGKLDNVEFEAVDETGQIQTGTVSIDDKGSVVGLTPKLAKGKRYTIALKAPGSLRRIVKVTAANNTTQVAFVLPMGDIYPIGGGDGAINTFDYEELKREWGFVDTSLPRPGDLNGDGVVNSHDWSCMLLFFNQQDAPVPTAKDINLQTPLGTGIPVSTPSATLSPTALPSSSPTNGGR